MKFRVLEEFLNRNIMPPMKSYTAVVERDPCTGLLVGYPGTELHEQAKLNGWLVKK